MTTKNTKSHGNTAETIEAKIAFLQELRNMISYVDDQINWKSNRDEDGNYTPPEKDDYGYNAYVALHQIKAYLETLV